MSTATIPAPFTSEPDALGNFGRFGGRYVPKTLCTVYMGAEDVKGQERFAVS